MPFPFSDLTSTKRRPALVIGELGGDDLVVAKLRLSIAPLMHIA
jgi:hypothetical protein